MYSCLFVQSAEAEIVYFFLFHTDFVCEGIACPTILSGIQSFVLLYSFRRYFGIVISHYQVALYSARRDEMIETVQTTLFYMNPDHPIPVHSTYAALPYEVRI